MFVSSKGVALDMGTTARPLQVLWRPTLGIFLPNEWTRGPAADRKSPACCGHGTNEPNAGGGGGGGQQGLMIGGVGQAMG